MTAVVRSARIRWEAALEYIRARKALFQAAVFYARARNGHGHSKGWGNRIVAEHRRLVRARYQLRTGQGARRGEAPTGTPGKDIGTGAR